MSKVKVTPKILPLSAKYWVFELMLWIIFLSTNFVHFFCGT